MSTLTKEKVNAIKADAGKLEKGIAAIGKVLSKELLWILFVVVASIPVAFIGLYWVEHYAPETLREVFELLAGDYPPYLVALLMSGMGIYVSRFVAVALKTQLETKKQE